MTWASLWWRLCLLGRMRRRQLSVTWRLWKRSRRPARPVRLPASDLRSPQYVPHLAPSCDWTRDILNTVPGQPIAINNYRQIQDVAVMQFDYVRGEWG
jgi:hypothetical protein